MKESYQERCRKPPTKAEAEGRLTIRTYQPKFRSLLYYEEKKHVELLSDKCDGDYRLTAYERGVIPPWVRRGDLYSRYGCLSGMRGDQIMYASQASECVFIFDKGREVCTAEILSENMQGHYDELLIEFKDNQARKLESHFTNFTGTAICRAEFEVKHFYFDLLHDSLNSLTIPQIRKVMPSVQSRSPYVLQSSPHPPPYAFLNLDKESQQPALQKILSESQYPVLISGAFGTGKTRLLAVATYHFIEEGKKTKTPTRVLLCSHHQVTADTFIEEYFGEMVRNQWNVKLARITRARYFAKSKYPHIYSNLHEFRTAFPSEYENQQFVVVVTTLLTGLNLQRSVKNLDKYFTHILLDEAAQAREPEAVAPLSMANQHTKIVIAGDDRQVGPGILVLGKMARSNGLATSLFARLLECYTKNNLPLAILNTNYRCHQEIVALARTLFYSTTDLKSCGEQLTIPGVKYPIMFVCSSLNKAHLIEEETDEAEVKALISQLKKIFKDPRQMKDVCIMATNRHQLSDIKTSLLKQRSRSSFIPTQFLPTYLVQGEEFKAVFMSTVEALGTTGCSLDPTKSLCSPSVFNTAITRAKSLIVAVGNPYILMRMEKEMGNEMHCWAEYLHRCFKADTVVAGKGIKDDSIQQLRRFVDREVQSSRACEATNFSLPLATSLAVEIQGAEGHAQESVKDQAYLETEDVFQQVLDRSEQLQQQLNDEQDKVRKKDHEISVLQQKLQKTQERQQNNMEDHRTTVKELQVDKQQQSLFEEEKAELKQQIQELQERLSKNQWLINAKEVEITDEVLGSGAWGEVKVAKFRGLRVAAKCLHKIINSEHNRRQFSHEMNIASQLRHPNLLLFIGAIREGDPVIITELMPTSLRKELEKKKLTKEQIIVVTRDVSCGLCYMHQSKPQPIIHCDISSGNVLLEPISNGWRAKISDYGSASQISTTIGPGCPTYAAPEAPYHADHTLKMDVFSLGVLMIEMCIGKLPAAEPNEREIQLRLIRWPEMVILIRKCIRENSADRPDSSEVMSELDQMYTEHTCTM